MSFFRSGMLPRVSRVLKRNIHGSRSLFTAASRSPIRTGVYTAAFVLSTGIFTVYYFDARSALHRYILTPVLRALFDAEQGHKIAVRVLKSGLGPRDPVSDNACLKSEIWGKVISNPIGLAAGFDKDGEAIDGIFNLGFSWVEIGSVTPRPQLGNPRPRVFGLPEDLGIINRYGFPSQGYASVLSRLRARIPSFQPEHENAALRPESILAINLGKNKESPEDSIEDFVDGVRTFGPYSDVLVVNVSSPNTPGLRGLQNRELLEKLVDGVIKARDELPLSALTFKRPKLILKIAPDLDELQIIDIANVIRDSGIDGVIVSNTTIQRPKNLINLNKAEAGGLSGKPLKEYSLKVLRILRSNLPASIPLIGCGGIFTGADALEFARAGASLVQVYTGFGYGGAGSCRKIKDQLVEQLGREGTTWGEVVKKAGDELSQKVETTESKVEESINHLISEAKELQGLLAKLEEEIESTAVRSQ